MDTNYIKTLVGTIQNGYDRLQIELQDGMEKDMLLKSMDEAKSLLKIIFEV